MKEKNKLGIYGIIGFVVWFLLQNYSDLPFKILNINPPTLFLEVYTILIEILTILFIFLLFKKEIVHMWKDFYENRDKYFNSSGIDVDSVLNSFFKGAAGKMLDNLIIEEFLRLQVDITNIISEDEDFMRKTIFSIKQ